MLQVITPGELTASMPNPTHTAKGIERIRALIAKLESFHQIMSGTGARHIEIADLAYKSKKVLNMVHFSPFCGTTDLYDGKGRIVLDSGKKVNSNEYFGVKSAYFKSWEFLKMLLDHALLCADPEFLITMGFVHQIQPGAHLYTINREAGMTSEALKLIA